jgi:hypothetical protein
VRAVSFPESYPKDPQDRLIGATALVEGTGLVTHDRGIAKSGLVPVIWSRNLEHKTALRGGIVTFFDGFRASSGAEQVL